MKKKAARKIVKISRKHWCRSDESGSALRTDSGQSCCLGFVARQCGVPTPKGIPNFKDLIEKVERRFGLEAALAAAALLPSELAPCRNAESLSWHDTDLHDELVSVNDDPKITAKEREKRIAVLFQKAGLVARFV